MNVSLTAELERRIDQHMETGLYTSTSELVREALRLFFQFDEVRRHEIDDLNVRIAAGLAQLERGEGIPAEQARKDSLERRARRVAAER
jgi:antitoxin ParD1/3/4